MGNTSSIPPLPSLFLSPCGSVSPASIISITISSDLFLTTQPALSASGVGVDMAVCVCVLGLEVAEICIGFL